MKHAFLVLLAGGPAHGYELKLALEQRFGDLLPPINAGQVYTTLARLERDGLVEGARSRVTDGASATTRSPRRAGGARSVARDARARHSGRRDEFATKLVLGGLPGHRRPAVSWSSASGASCCSGSATSRRTGPAARTASPPTS